jgi:hydroxyacylglutathione hydrolase/adenylyltransferase/sulfurtransferase
MSEFADASVDITPAEASRRMQAGDLLLVDIREQYEWDAGRVPGARHIEIERVASQAPSISRDEPVAFVCRGGVRAGMVAQAFRAIGYDAYNVLGGMTAWHEQGLPMEPEGAVVAPH